MRRKFGLFICTAACVAIFGSLAAYAAEDAVSFYKSHPTITMIVGSPVGANYDLPARLVARHIGNHIPGNPKIVVQSMPGASSVTAASYVINTAPQDGTIICNVLNTLPLNQVLGMVKTNLDVSELQWIGNPSREVYIMVVNSIAPATTYKEMLEKQVIMGASTSGSLSWMYPQVMNTILGTKFKIVGGYGGFSAIDLAMARGEVDGDVGAPWYDINSAAGYSPKIREGILKVVVQVGHQKAQQLPEVPLLNDLANSSDDRTLMDLFTSPTEFGKPTVMSPHVPADRVAVMRKAYMDTMKDPAFIADATEQGLTVDPVTGEELQAYAKKIVATPKALIERGEKAIADQSR